MMLNKTCECGHKGHLHRTPAFGLPRICRVKVCNCKEFKRKKGVERYEKERFN